MPAAARARKPADPEKAAAAREERLAQLHDQLAAGVAAARSSAGWRAWLDVAARFPSYSLNNVLLIQAQRPGASMVCGYRAWQAIGRQVRKGEKGIYILAPILTRNPRNQPDPGETQGVGERIDLTNTATTASPEKRPQRLVGFRPVAVFDLASTDGDPIPTPPRPQLLAGEAPPGLWDALAEVAADHGYNLARCADADAIGGANGITDFTTHTITVRADIDPAQAVKTLAHEIGHATLHTPGAGQPWLCRGTAEVEAESVAYLVAAHHGMDTSGYTFDYIAGWAPDDQTITSTATRVLQAARNIIAATDPQPGITEQTADVVIAGRDAANAVAEHATRTQAALTGALAERQQEAPSNVTPARIREINAAAAAWFTTQAADSEEFSNAAAQRGHDPAALIGLGVGWAPPGWSGLTDHLTVAGYTIDELQAAGVTRTSHKGQAYDLFRGRIMFPINEPTGAVAGFTGRDATGREGAPKYLNTPANSVYRKGQLLYGTAQITDDTKQVVLVEGPWDALAVTLATRDSADPSVGLAACGTAITPEHLELAATLGGSIILCPDPDPAGVAALGRTTDHLTRTTDGHPRAIALPPGTDLADLHAASGTAGIRSALQSAQPAGIVYARSWLAINPPSRHPHDRVNAARAAAAYSRAMTASQRGGLAAALLSGAGITPETAIELLTGTHPPGAARAGSFIGAPPRPPAAARH